MKKNIKNSIIKILPAGSVKFLKKIRSLARSKYLSLTNPRLSKERFIADLRKMGINRGDLIFAHSSMKSFGFVEGGAKTVIDALIEAIGPEGTLAMPCFSIIGSMKETLESGCLFNLKETPATVGVIPETFRNRAGIFRSLHPTHSICAFGRKAEFITRGHEKAATTFGEETPFFKIMEQGGLILGLGVDFGPVTFVHVIEDVAHNFPIDVYGRKEYVAKMINEKGDKIEIKLKAQDPEAAKTRIDKKEGEWIRKFFTDYLINKKFLKTGEVGPAKCWLIKAKDLFEAQQELLEQGITVYSREEDFKRKG